MIDDKELVIEVEGLIPFRMVDQYGLENKLIIESLLKQIDYLTNKIESIGLNLDEKIKKDNYYDNIENIDKVKNIISKKDYLYIKYDHDCYFRELRKQEYAISSRTI